MYKIVNLKSNKVAKINTSFIENFHYINAVDNNKSVGLCKFSFSYVYTRDLSEESRKLYARNHKISLDKTPTHITRVLKECDLHKYTTKDNLYILITNNCKEYHLSEIICNLNSIEILDERFFNVGLGSTMLHELEDMANSFNCNKIVGMYEPNGNFQHGTRDFYIRNGFNFLKDKNV